MPDCENSLAFKPAMTWEELKEKAKELGYSISSYINEDEIEIEYIDYNDHIYLDENGTITTSIENFVADHRTPDQMYQIMLALR